jgi:hypothetical protein
MGKSGKQEGERNLTVRKRITFVKSCGSYKAGDGLQLDSSEAATLVDAGFAIYSEEYRKGK